MLLKGHTKEAETLVFEENMVEFEEYEEVAFWEWDYVIVFKNPDAQRERKLITVGKAYKMI